MKARYVGKCLFCTPCARAVKVNDEVVRHPTVPENEDGTINWVHARHIKVQGQQHLFIKMEKPSLIEEDKAHQRRDWGDF